MNKLSTRYRQQYLRNPSFVLQNRLTGTATHETSASVPAGESLSQQLRMLYVTGYVAGGTTGDDAREPINQMDSDVVRQIQFTLSLYPHHLILGFWCMFWLGFLRDAMV